MTVTLSPWREAAVYSGAAWGSLSKQLAPNGDIWGVVGPDHNQWRASSIIRSSDGTTWAESSITVTGTTLTPYWSVWAQGVAQGVMVLLVVDWVQYLGYNPSPPTRAGLLRSTDNGTTWAYTELGTAAYEWKAGGPGGFVDLGDGFVGIPVWTGDGASGNSLGFLASDDGFATHETRYIVQATDVLADPDRASFTAETAVFAEFGAAFSGNVGVCHTRRDARALYGESADGSTQYDAALTQFVTLDGGQTWTHTGRLRSTGGALAAPYFTVGGDVWLHGDRFYSIAADRRYNYNAPTNPAVHQSAVWIWSIAVADLAADPYAEWTIEAEKHRPNTTRDYVHLGMATVVQVDGTQYLIADVDAGATSPENSDLWVADLTLPEVSASVTGHAGDTDTAHGAATVAESFATFDLAALIDSAYATFDLAALIEAAEVIVPPSRRPGAVTIESRRPVATVTTRRPVHG